MAESRDQLVKYLVDACHRLYAKGFVAATDGNVSARLQNGNYLTTRSAINKGNVTPDDLLEVDQQGNVIPSHPAFKPSTELGMHLFIYAQRPDVQAIVHAHPPFATGFAAARQPLDSCVFPEVIAGLGAIPLADYATPSTVEVANSLAPFVKSADAILLANHGVVTYGVDVMDAYYKMEKVEHAAHITFVARMLGGEKPLSSEQIEKLRGISVSAYGKDFSGKPACEPESVSGAPSDEEIRSLVRQMIQKDQ
ncbi:MAG TPA: class II aldolase/adducin family protein [Bacteroidota bacterium]|nr:class II aldolase/adducin family protein [Bacteroidota bacterium]